jgi:hypothetical protein
MSFGDEDDPSLKKAIEEFKDLLFVSASGNNAADLDENPAKKRRGLEVNWYNRLSELTCA